MAAEGKAPVPYGPTFGFGDVIGCGINYLTSEVRKRERRESEKREKGREGEEREKRKEKREEER